MIVTTRQKQLGFVDAIIGGLIGLVAPKTAPSCPAPPPPPWYGTPSGAAGLVVGSAAVGGLLVFLMGGRK